MKKISLAVIVSYFAIASAHAGGIGDNGFKDTDWGVPMYNWDNDYKHGQDIKWVKYNGDQALQFTLEGGKPGIADDDRPTERGALFRERNELHSDYFNRDDHIINFKFKMIQGFNGRKETFFQIHSYNSYCAMIQGKFNVHPTLMLQAHKGRIGVVTKSRKENDRRSWTRTWLPLHKKELINNWNDITITTSSAYDDYMQYTIKSESLGIDYKLPASYISPCGKQYIKFGVYRPSFVKKVNGALTTKGINETSIIQFDDVNIIKP